ncbi:MAG: hypothetical protein WC544_01800 [Patescibacteria group bacterium]
METKRKNDITPLAEAATLVEYCPLCDATFHPKTVSVIGGIEHTQLIHTTCTSCGSSVVVLLLVSEAGLRSVGFLTDLTEQDAARLQHLPSVASDDVLELYRMLEDNRFPAGA